MRKRILVKTKSALDREFYIAGFGLSGRKVVAHPLFSGSAIMIVGTNLGNFISYIYHLILGRLLGPSGYGELVAVIAIVGLFATSFSFIGLVVTKFVSAGEKKDHGAMLAWFNRKISVLAIVIGVAALLLSGEMGSFLRIEQKILILVAPIFFVNLLSLVYKSFLQGLLKFKEIVYTIILEAGGKLVFALIFIYLGYSVFGAVVGFLLAAIAGLGFARYLLKDLRNTDSHGEFKAGKKVFTYAIPVFLALLASNSFYQTDVILVKHFFTARDAGLYAAMSNLGKVIFFATSPVGAVMFPMVSKRHHKGQDYIRILVLSVVSVSIIAIGVLAIYFIAPELMIRILYGIQFIDAAPYLFRFSIFMSMFTISFLIVNFFLSIEKTKVVVLPLMAAGVQAVGIWIFHDSIVEVVNVSIVASLLLLLSLLVYFGYEIRKKR